jgi:photosystem II stability/assembly factor-like uncharacterized protein
MTLPKDPIQDELAYPEQTTHLQHHYAPSQADAQSLQSIRARLRSQQIQRVALPRNEPLPQLSTGQFFTTPQVVPTVSHRKRVPAWSLVAVLCLLCVLVSAGAWYTLVHVSHKPTLPTPPQPGIAHQNITFSRLKMTSALVGWGLAETGMGTNVNSSIARTTDGGRSWRILYQSKQGIGVMSWFFLDDKTAWVTLGTSAGPDLPTTVVHTIDGGAHWTRLQLPVEISSYTFLDQLHGWAWTDDVPSRNIYKTNDGGKTWNKITTPDAIRPPSIENQGMLPSFQGLDMAFVTPQHGWLISYNTRYDPDTAYYYASFLTTLDGGKSWQTQSLPQPASGPIPGIDAPLIGATAKNQNVGTISISAPHFFTPQQGIISVTSAISSNAPRKIYLYTTNDAGQHWSLAGTSITIASNVISSVVPLDLTHVIISKTAINAINSTVTRYTFIKGQWQATSIQHFGAQEQSYALSFADSQHGWQYTIQQINGKESLMLYSTHDGGQSWQAIMNNTIPIPPRQQGG